MNKIIDSLLEYNKGDWEETAEDIKMLYQIAKLKADDIMFEWVTVCEENDKCPECGADMEYIDAITLEKAFDNRKKIS